jgi:glycosyltransferase involved in cell wall biosynthesis
MINVKKILLMNDSGSPDQNQGGGNKIIYEIINGIFKDKYSVDFISYKLFLENKQLLKGTVKQENKKYYLDYLKLLLIKLGVFHKLVSNSFYFYYHMPKRIKYFNTFSDRSWDLIHCHHSLSLAYLKSTNKSKKILTLHSKGPFVQDVLDNHYNNKFFTKHLSFFEKLENESIEKADVITFPSIASKERFIEQSSYNRFHKKDIRIVYNGVDINYINSVKPDEEFEEIKKKYEIVVLNVAQHIKPKNINIILEAVSILLFKYKNNILFVNIGSGIETNELLNAVDKLKIKQNVMFLGNVSNYKVVGIMKVCDFFIMPSTRVVFDMTILEALAAGCCVIASNDGGNKEIIEHGINGYLLQELSGIHIAESILTARKDITKQNAEERIKKYSSTAMIKNYQSIYNELLI